MTLVVVVSITCVQLGGARGGAKAALRQEQKEKCGSNKFRELQVWANTIHFVDTANRSLGNWMGVVDI